MFIDSVNIEVIAGKWWDGLVSWRKEKCIPNGGPWWGDGGNGGSVYFQTTSNLNTLSYFRHKKVLQAQDGEKGGIKLMHGANAEDMVLHVPVGTIVKDALTGETIVDLDQNNLKYLIAVGGRGGYGNAHFVSSTRQAPSFAELWDVWWTRKVSLELKLVADIGIIGIPSAWKSSLIASMTQVKPKIWDYPFTTLTPNLGVLEHKNKTLVLEDVPWLIPWASEGKWLGIDFLKHIERTKVILHLLDLYRLDDLMQDYRDIRHELESFSKELAEKEEIIVFSKADLLDSEMKQFIAEEFQKHFWEKTIFIVSAATGEWLKELKDALIDGYTTSLLPSQTIECINENLKVINLHFEEDPRNIELEYIGNYTFTATGKRIEQIVRMTDFSNLEAVMRVYDVLEKLQVIRKLEAKLETITKEEKISTDHFFEGNDDPSYAPKIIIAGKEIPLDKLKYQL